MAIRIGILKETTDNETRVALVPEIAKKLAANGARFHIEKGSGRSAGYNDNDYPEACVFKKTKKDVLSDCDILFTVAPPNDQDIKLLKESAIVIGFMNPFDNADLIKQMAKQNLISFSVELIPRISRAQSMDALSSQASIAGYKAVVLAANHSNKFFPMLTTAAGTVRPSQILVIGAGVAGLQAIATAKRLGSKVLAFDVRSSTKEQIESLGAKFLDTGVSAEGDGGYARELTKEELKKQKEILVENIGQSDVVITTAAVPGKPAPKLIDKATVSKMMPGSVIVDLGAVSGGNCEVTKKDETIDFEGVIVCGPTNLAATMPKHASELYSKNLANFLLPAMTENGLHIDWDDEIFKGANLTNDGKVTFSTNGK
tara:strand:+ start:2091 stop:3206 length:1116 start_codon:yes stop_codon:yes gene_type:complete